MENTERTKRNYLEKFVVANVAGNEEKMSKPKFTSKTDVKYYEVYLKKVDFNGVIDDFTCWPFLIPEKYIDVFKSGVARCYRNGDFITFATL